MTLQNLDELLRQSPAAKAGAPAGRAAIYYRIGTQAPVQVLTQCFQQAVGSKSLALWFYDPAPKPVRFLMFLSLSNIYIGPGEYKGNVNDIEVGLGVATAEGEALTWTAGDSTGTDLITYSSKQVALPGTFTVQGLLPGPMFGPPVSPPPPNQPTLQVLLGYFEVEGGS